MIDRHYFQLERKNKFGTIKKIYSTAKENDTYVRVCAPMVRYSRLPFRQLVRSYGVDLVFSPMLISDSFLNSESARDADLRTNTTDGPLIVQFASNNGEDHGKIAQGLWGHCEGIDLNCGCPQRWVNALNYGDVLMKQPERIADIVKSARRAVPDDDFCISVKMRVFDDLKATVSLAQQIESMGAGLLSIHGRTHSERDQPVRDETIRIINETLSIPVNYNGSIESIYDCERAYKATGCLGMMVARGLLHNPGLFAGKELGDREVLTEWTQIAVELGIPFSSYHKHLMYMLEKVTQRPETRVFNGLQSTIQAVTWLQKRNYINSLNL